MSYAMEEGPRQHRITVDEYHRMAEVGLLAPDARVELIEGVIIDMAPIESAHGMAVDLFTELLVTAVRGRAIVRAQGAIQLSRWSEPQPDIALLKPRKDRYRGSNPEGGDIFLVVEVSESSLKYDLDTKSRLYARHGVPELWVVDVEGGVLHFFRSRTDLCYVDVSSTSEPGVLQVPSLDATIDLSALFRIG